MKRGMLSFESLKSVLRPRFSIDTRALATFRMGIGVILILDILLRWRNVEAFYTDNGVLPRSAAVFDSMPYSLHTIMGSTIVVKIIFIATILIGIAILVGYYSNIALVGGWVLVYSIHSRNPFILAGADTLFYLLLLWGIFLPLSKRWALRPKTTEDNDKTTFTIATIGILLQVWLVYIVSGIHKLRGPEWVSGNAVNQIFQVDQIIILFGKWIADLGVILTTINYLWMVLLIASPLMLITTKWVRTAFVSALIGGHIMMGLSIKLGLFPLVTIIGLILFYPPFVWDVVEQVFVKNTRVDPVLDAMRSANIIKNQNSLKQLFNPPKTITPFTSKVYNIYKFTYTEIVPLVFIVLILLSVGQTVGVADTPDQIEEITETTKVDQSWYTFAPDPVDSELWFTTRGVLTNGTVVDIYRKSSVSFERPKDMDNKYNTIRWGTYLGNVEVADHLIGDTDHHKLFANYLCNNWNKNHEEKVTQVEIYAVEKPSVGENKTELFKESLIKHNCNKY